MALPDGDYMGLIQKDISSKKGKKDYSNPFYKWSNLGWLETQGGFVKYLLVNTNPGDRSSSIK